MEVPGIYFAAVVHDRTSPDHAPFVGVPLGPYHPDEIGAHEAAKTWLRTQYRTEDIRRVETDRPGHDFDTARGMVLQAVNREHEQERRRREQGAQIKIFCNTDPATESLDRILEVLGVDPRDV